MNLNNLNKLLSWLDAGAPEVTLKMNVGIDGNRELEGSPASWRSETNQVPEPECGTVCCIAGAAVLMSVAPEGAMFPPASVQRRMQDSHGWDIVRRKALVWLGLPSDGGFLGHDLFDHNLAPEYCTPKQAAQAVRNVMEGKDPWN